MGSICRTTEEINNIIEIIEGIGEIKNKIKYPTSTWYAYHIKKKIPKHNA